jgi:TRAP-type C4-dicarboxylate transport system permease small subunit
MAASFRRAMDLLYMGCVIVAGLCLVAIAVVIPYGVYMRYIVNRSASWPEPMAILLTIVLTFIGGAACYRTGTHMRVTLVRSSMPAVVERGMTVLAELLMAALAMFMLIDGTNLVQATWFQGVAEFPAIRVGVSYLPIPISGVVLMLFVLEHLLIGPPILPGHAPGSDEDLADQFPPVA